MIERNSIKFGPAVSQKEAENAARPTLTPHETSQASLMKGRLEVVGDFGDIKKLHQLLKDLSAK
jgi:hypothetical protein